MAGSVHRIIRNYPPRDKSSLIAILQAIQRQQGYLSPQAVEIISKHLGISKSQVFSVATFYRSFSFTPKGKCCLSVCMGTACHVRGAQIITEELERVLGIKAGGTTQDMKFTLETVNCLGACALGPIVVEDGKYHGQMNIGKTQALLERIQGVKKPQGNEEI
jgi:NADH-quinone oxidoreductase subunit E